MIKVIGFQSAGADAFQCVLSSLAELPAAHKAGLQVLRYTPEGINLYALSGPGKRHAGVYYEELDAICIRQFSSLANLRETIFHETGHHVFRRHLSQSRRHHWVTRIRPGSRCVTDYARRNAAEDFAESYMAYLARPERLRAIPEKYDFIAALFRS